jgi:hypothetical protein
LEGLVRKKLSVGCGGLVFSVRHVVHSGWVGDLQSSLWRQSLLAQLKGWLAVCDQAKFSTDVYTSGLKLSLECCFFVGH